MNGKFAVHGILQLIELLSTVAGAKTHSRWTLSRWR